MAQGRKKQNTRLENAIDETVIEALEAQKLTVRSKIESIKDINEKKPWEKKFNRLSLAAVRFRKRIENRLATPKSDVDLEDLL